MKTILVTGGAGFIGSNLGNKLIEQGYRVRILDNLSAGTEENVPAGSDFRNVDICDSNLKAHFEGVDAIFHLAAKNCLADCAASPFQTNQINAAGTANVIQNAIECGIRNFVYADTSAEYEGILDFPSRIDRTLPLSVYACSKHAGFLACQALSRMHEITVTTVRYFNVYGPAQDWRRVIPPVMSAFTFRLLQGKQPTIFGDGTKSRDFVHVDDVNEFHLKILEDPSVRGGIYNLGSGQDFSVNEIYRRIEAIIESGLTPIRKPELPAEAQRTLADISETQKTGWSPKVSLDDGLKSFIDYVRSKYSSLLSTSESLV